MNTEPRLDRVPPQNIDAERAVLGAMLQPDDNSESIPISMSIVTSTDFYKTSHEKIYRAIERLYDNDEKVDLLTVTKALEASGDLELVGGVPYLDEMIESVPTAKNVDIYARMVKEEAVRRKLIHASAQTYSKLFDASEEVGDVVIELEQAIADINKAQSNGSMRKVKDVLKPTFARIQELSQGDISILGLSTGLSYLDDLTSGLQKGELIVIAGRPGMGKSMFVQNITEHVVVKEERTAVIFSMEMTAEQWVTRMLSSQSGVSFQAIRTGRFADSVWPKLTIAAGKVSAMPLYIEDSGGLKVRDMRMKLSQLRTKEELSLVVVDYLQLCESEREGNRNDEVTAISRGLKSLAMEFDVPVIAVSQLSRKPEGRDAGNKRPQLSDLRESGAIEQDADVVMFVYREHYYDKSAMATDAEIIIEKQRNGPLGTVHLFYEPTKMRFKSMAKGEYQ